MWKARAVKTITETAYLLVLSIPHAVFRDNKRKILLFLADKILRTHIFIALGAY